jgi:hypothetical protein
VKTKKKTGQRIEAANAPKAQYVVYREHEHKTYYLFNSISATENRRYAQ